MRFFGADNFGADNFSSLLETWLGADAEQERLEGKEDEEEFTRGVNRSSTS